jgi:hypothetical protein
MRSRSFTMLVAVGLIGLVVAGAAPAGATPRAPATTVPTCSIATPHGLIGSSFLNGKTVNGTWYYAVGVVCNANVGDIALYDEIDYQGMKVESHTKGFTGTPHSQDNEGYFPVPCAVCSGTWTFVTGEILKAPAGFTWVSSGGCVALSSGLYLFCVQQLSEVIP